MDAPSRRGKDLSDVTYERRRMLALATNPVDGASTRFRVEQWRPWLEAQRIRLQLEPFYSSEATRLLYRQGSTVAKIGHFSAGAMRRLNVLRRLPQMADLVFVHREAFPLGWPVLVDHLRRFPGPIIYDYDDALFVPQRRGRGVLEWLERLDTPRRLIGMSDAVFAGSPILADYARQFSDRVTLLPTCIDTDRFTPSAPRPDGRECVVGWIGSHSTAKYLNGIIPALERAAERIPFALYVVGVPFPITVRGVTVTQVPWSLSREVEDFQRCDIGVYPLWDDEWSRGKCGFKAIQFMACGTPVIAAGVGVTLDIIEPGVNGMLASTTEEWAAALIRLLSNPTLRRRLGSAGRTTIERRYSLQALGPVFTGAVQRAISRAPLRRAG